MKWMKNRTVLGILCITVSLLLCFVITPLVNKELSKKTTVVRMQKAGRAGEEITRDMIKEVEVGSFNLPTSTVKKAEDVLGMYLKTDVCVDDTLLINKISRKPARENAYLYQLNGEKQAISITLHTFAQGVSGKLKAGDVVSVIAPDYQGSGKTVIPRELKYVEVIAATAKSGTDANTGEKASEEEKELPSTVTLLTFPAQSRLLAQLEAEGEIHLALVYRGTEENAQKFLEEQEEVLKETGKEKENGEAVGQ